MAASDAVNVTRRQPCPVDLYRALYRDVGAQWYWHDRLEWTDAQLAEHLARPDVAVWVMASDETPLGFVELQRHQDASVEIVYLGLLPEYIGQGLGGLLLNHAVEEAWALRANRVWLHTCTLDSDHALPNYKARGFREYKTQRLEVDIEGSEVVGERLLHD